VLLLGLAAWLNGLLALANLLPVFPFDGAIAYRAALRQRVGAATAAVYVSRGGYFCALALLALAWWSHKTGPASTTPAWLALLLAAVFVAFSAHRDRRRFFQMRSENSLREGGAHGISNDFIDFEEDPLVDGASSAEAWSGVPKTGSELWRTSDEEAEEARLDDVLAKLHHFGFDGLSMEDRQFLDRASQRYRSRRQNRSTEDA
jgi:hypothetical protein